MLPMNDSRHTADALLPMNDSHNTRGTSPSYTH